MNREKGGRENPGPLFGTLVFFVGSTYNERIVRRQIMEGDMCFGVGRSQHYDLA